jgi:hypothetical protein
MGGAEEGKVKTSQGNKNENIFLSMERISRLIWRLVLNMTASFIVRWH